MKSRHIVVTVQEDGHAEAVAPSSGKASSKGVGQKAKEPQPKAAKVCLLVSSQ